MWCGCSNTHEPPFLLLKKTSTVLSIALAHVNHHFCFLKKKLQPLVLSKKKKKKTQPLFYLLHSYTFIISEKIEEREGERTQQREREGEGRWRSRVAGKTKPVEIDVYQTAVPHPPSHHRFSSSPPLDWVRSGWLSFFLFSYFLVLIQLCCYNKK